MSNKNQPIINIIVFHDGENCFIPKKEICRDKNGKMIFSNSHTKFSNNNIDYIGELIKQNVIKESFDILKKNEYKRNKPFINFPNIDLDNIDFRKVNCNYFFVLQKFIHKRNNFYPSHKTNDSLCNSLFNINAHTKGVDLKINELIDATIKIINKDSPTLFIIISGDGDFRNSIQNAYQSGFECCVLFNSDTNLTSNFDAFIKDCGFSRNSWWNVLDKCCSNYSKNINDSDSLDYKNNKNYQENNINNKDNNDNKTKSIESIKPDTKETIKPETKKTIKPDSKDIKPKSIESIKPESKDIKPKSIESIKPESKDIKPKSIESIKSESKETIKPKSIESIKPESKDIKPKSIETIKSESKDIKPKSIETIKSETKETIKPDSKDIKPKSIETIKPKSIETIKPESKETIKPEIKSNSQESNKIKPQITIKLENKESKKK